MIDIRAAVAGDARALAAVAAATFPLACPPGTSDEAIAAFIAEHLSEQRFEEYLADPQRDLLIAELDGAPAGYTMLVAGDPTDAHVAAAVTVRPTVELSKCYVLADHHGQGVAGELIERSIEAAVARGARSIWLGVNQHNARANAFYGKHGFEVAGTKHFMVGDERHDDFVRVRPLD
ncbi:ribosomal protein S18 acetylase RimI-like enzyme [Diaminobutyricimonas aerilata]|uniref:Ribosomal protein S18 acetylase RimI-like enzyme n=1 Tax=Diaminobutyricimonas aerilata TaxID=1162967 RepID=A0A2M9CGG9_9MICO|nr:GNAT family N-acetyltransferase [Diaminobutyricimonas aerilata]PJJ70979.1 ribosomal protein S18 acetylase RimI-like enzyme [Diaminobutyricimonas aerilata]